MGIKTYARAARSLFRLSALRVASDYPTVSYEALGVISGITPPDAKAMELKMIYDRVRIIGRTLTTEEQREERQNSLDERQIRWDTATQGRWTHRLIGYIESWVERRHGHVVFTLHSFWQRMAASGNISVNMATTMR